MYLQRTAGNAATTQFIQQERARADAPAFAGPTVQRGTEGSGGETATTSTASTTDPGPPTPLTDWEKEQLDNKLNSVGKGFSNVLLLQIEGVKQVEKYQEKGAAVPLSHVLLQEAAKLALTFALGGVGAAVGKAAENFLNNRKINDTIVLMVSNGVNDALKQGVSDGIGASMSSSGVDSVEQFFGGMSAELVKQSLRAERIFDLQWTSKIRRAKDPLAVADALIAGQDAQVENAKELQAKAALDEWTTYLANQALGETGEGEHKGTNLGDQMGDTSAEGVLGIVIKGTSPWAEPTIVRGEIEGLNKFLITMLGNRPIGEIRVPMTVKGWLGYAPYDGWIEFGKNRAETFWLGDTDYQAQRWLYQRTHPDATRYMAADGSTHIEYPDRDGLWTSAFAGARSLMQGLAHQTMGSKLEES